MIGFVSPASNSTVAITSLTNAINKRMLQMKDVAAYKAENHLPVEDLGREENVLFIAQVDAEKAGLDPQSTMPFVQAQMDVAKAIQHRYIAEWLSLPREIGCHKPLDEVRTLISVLDKDILNYISTKLLTGTFTDEDKSRIFISLHTPHLTDADKRRLIYTLSLIRRPV